MEDFESIIRNKNIVIVGPANYLTNSEHGKIIDSYDVVVKIKFKKNGNKNYCRNRYQSQW
jgi:hypothetical protein